MALTLGREAHGMHAVGIPTKMRLLLARRPIMAVAFAALLLAGLVGAWAFGQVGELTVTSDPPGATVFLDGKRVGTTPFVVDTRMLPREGRISLQADGRESVSRRFVVRPGTQDTLGIVLPLAGGVPQISRTLSIESTPPGASVTVDGKERGRTPLEVTDLSSGRHTVALALNEHRSETRTVLVPEQTNLRVTLQRLVVQGQLRVESTPAGATLWLDGTERGHTPLALEGIDPGRHEVRLAAPRHETLTRHVDVEVGKTASLTAALERIALPEGFSPAPEKAPVVVMVENHPDSWPHSGLDRADVVYEALVEGGVTRFMAVYSRQDAEVVGPVRSMRDYYVYWASEYKPIFAHIGGSPQSYNATAATGISHFEESPGYGYWRSRDRYAPHNAYLDTATVRASADKLDLLGKGAFSGLVQHADWPVPTAEPARSVTMRYPGGYQVDYAYDPETKHYKRFMNGTPHRDAVSGEQLAARALILQRVGTRSIDAVDRQQMDAVGSGKIAYMIDGRAGVGTWRKASLTAPTYFFDSEGERLVLPPGQVWIQVVPLQSSMDWGA